MKQTECPAIAVVVPVYNGARYLKQCLDSLMQQSFGDFEVLIRDDGSSDGSHDLIEQYRDPRVRILPGGSNLGLFPNVNRLIEASRAPLIRVLCQDDILEADCLKAEVAFCAAHPEVGMAFGKVLSIDAAGDPLEYWPVEGQPELLPPALSMQMFFYYGCIVGNLSNAVMRRTVLDQVGLFDVTYPVAGDYEMWVRIGRSYSIGTIRQPILRVRSHSEQLSRTVSSSIASIRESRRIQASILPLLPDSVRSYARRYRQMRQNVLDVHYALRRLSKADLRTCLAVLSSLGPRDTLGGMLFWLLTLNNRLLRPQPRFADSHHA